jgi:hypothetical protein
MGDGSTSLPLALAKDDVKWGNAPGGITAALRVGGSVAAASGERRGKGTALSSSGLVYAVPAVPGVPSTKLPPRGTPFFEVVVGELFPDPSGDPPREVLGELAR